MLLILGIYVINAVITYIFTIIIRTNLSLIGSSYVCK